MAEADAASVLAIQQAAYPATHHESWAVLGRKLALWPQGCWVLTDGADLPQAYLFSHPWRADAPPAMDSEIEALPDDTDTYVLHDLALHPRAQGQGLGLLLWRKALLAAQTAGLNRMNLVAVQGSAPFWTRQGFESVAPISAEMAEKLAGYGGDAVFMHRLAQAKA